MTIRIATEKRRKTKVVERVNEKEKNKRRQSKRLQKIEKASSL